MNRAIQSFMSCRTTNDLMSCTLECRRNFDALFPNIIVGHILSLFLSVCVVQGEAVALRGGSPFAQPLPALDRSFVAYRMLTSSSPHMGGVTWLLPAALSPYRNPTSRWRAQSVHNMGIRRHGSAPPAADAVTTRRVRGVPAQASVVGSSSSAPQASNTPSPCGDAYW